MLAEDEGVAFVAMTHLATELKERLQYRLDNVFASGPLAQFGLLLLMSLLVVLIGATAYFAGLFSAANRGVAGISGDIDRGFWDTVWWSLKHVFDPAFFDSDYGATLPVVLISLLISLLGMVLFAMLIGFISSGIDARLELLRRGNSLVKEQGHILILGWSNKVGAILRLLAAYRTGLKVVILSTRDTELIREALRLEGVTALPIRYILRRGDPSSLAELERVAFAQAFSIIVLACENEDQPGSNPDAEAIRTLMLLASYDGWQEPRPKIVAEVTQKENLEIATIAAAGRIPVVCSAQIISRIIVQASRQVGLSAVYAELFSFAGNEIYVRGFAECEGKRFGDIAHAFPGAVPIGTSRARQQDGRTLYEPTLAPGCDYVVQPGEWLIFIAESDQIFCDLAVLPPAIAPLPPEALAPVVPERILILGWNGSIHDILLEYDAYMSGGGVIDVVSNYTPDEAAERLAAVGETHYRGIQVRFHRARAVTRPLLERFDPASYDCVVLLADESRGESDPDGSTILTQILLRDLISSRGGERRPHMLAEIVTPRSRDLLVSTGLDDIIVSPEIVSLQITQVSQQQILMGVYQELMNAGGVEIYLKPAQRYAALGEPITFGELMGAAQQRREIAIGVDRRHGDGVDGRREVLLNPPRDVAWRLGPRDRVIVIAPDLYE